MDRATDFSRTCAETVLEADPQDAQMTRSPAERRTVFHVSIIWRISFKALFTIVTGCSHFVIEIDRDPHLGCLECAESPW
jgi:hypothetical protein